MKKRMRYHFGGCLEAPDCARRREAALSPAQRERREIEDMFAEAEQIARSDSDDNVWRPMQLRGEARKRLAAWRLTNPREAAAERASELRAAADHEDHLASGALIYDADGSLSAEMQERRAAEFRAKAADLRAQADELLK